MINQQICVLGRLNTVTQKKEFYSHRLINRWYSDDFHIHIDTISMGLPIVYFKGPQVQFSKK